MVLFVALSGAYALCRTVGRCVGNLAKHPFVILHEGKIDAPLSFFNPVAGFDRIVQGIAEDDANIQRIKRQLFRNLQPRLTVNAFIFHQRQLRA